MKKLSIILLATIEGWKLFGYSRQPEATLKSIGGKLDELADGLDALGVEANRNRPREGRGASNFSQGQSFDRLFLQTSNEIHTMLKNRTMMMNSALIISVQENFPLLVATFTTHILQ